MANEARKFEVYDPDLYNEQYSDATRENMPRLFSERFPPIQMIFDVSLVLEAMILTTVNMQPPGGGSGGVMALAFILLIPAAVGLITAPIHLIGLLGQRRAVREEIIEWARRGWTRPGFEPTEEMLDEADRRNEALREKQARYRQGEIFNPSGSTSFRAKGDTEYRGAMSMRATPGQKNS